MSLHADIQSLQLAAVCWEAQAQTFETGMADDGAAGRIALLLRECAREAVWVARQLAVAEACQADTEDVGRDHEYPPALAIVRTADGAA